MKLHMDFLSAHSSLLRGVFGGASPVDLINTTITSSHETSTLRRWFAHAHTIPHFLLSLILSSFSLSWIFPALHTLFPLHHLDRECFDFRYCWEGLVRNVDYLGMPCEIRSFFNKRYRKWLLVQERTGTSERDMNQKSRKPRTIIRLPPPLHR